LFNAGIAISIGATVLSLGMTYTVGQLVAPLHRVVLVIAMVVLNAGVIPALAWGIAEITPMDSKYVPGLVLATVGAGSAASLKAAQLASGRTCHWRCRWSWCSSWSTSSPAAVGRTGRHRRLDQRLGHRQEPALGGAAAAGGRAGHPRPLRRSRQELASPSW